MSLNLFICLNEEIGCAWIYTEFIIKKNYKRYQKKQASEGAYFAIDRT